MFRCITNFKKEEEKRKEKKEESMEETERNEGTLPEAKTEKRN